MRILADETLVENHPWISDPQDELERLEKQKQKEQEEFEKQQYDPFAPGQGQQKGGVNDGTDGGEKPEGEE